MKGPEGDNEVDHIMPKLAHMPGNYCAYDHRDHNGMRIWLSEPLDPFGFMYTIAQLHISSTGNDAPENLIYAVYLLAPSFYGYNKKETWI
jgi:hypothetical protein